MGLGGFTAMFSSDLISGNECNLRNEGVEQRHHHGSPVDFVMTSRIFYSSFTAIDASSFISPVSRGCWKLCISVLTSRRC
jgi:hypothetical protein